jgi:hypothetical protein
MTIDKKQHQKEEYSKCPGNTAKIDARRTSEMKFNTVMKKSGNQQTEEDLFFYKQSGLKFKA